MMDRMPFYFDELPQPPLFGGVRAMVSDESARDDRRGGEAPHDKPQDTLKQEPKQPPKQPPKQTFKQDLLIETPEKQKSQKPKDHNRNHRQRLRSRFMRAGKQALQDYELLELIMFRAIPRRDIKPLAKTLLAEFGDFNRVISAPSSRLLAIKGVGESVIQEFRIVTAAAERLAQVEVLNRNILSDTGRRCSPIAILLWRIRKMKSFGFCFWIKKAILSPMRNSKKARLITFQFIGERW